jgi:predicted DNA-binding antitoxin AbrB/MazE fold protein
MNAIRAIYEGGKLRLLEPVNLIEGQEVELVLKVTSEQDRVRAALADLPIRWPDMISATEDDLDEAALAREIEEGFRNAPPLSETIIQERRESP